MISRAYGGGSGGAVYPPLAVTASSLELTNTRARFRIRSTTITSDIVAGQVSGANAYNWCDASCVITLRVSCERTAHIDSIRLRARGLGHDRGRIPKIPACCHYQSEWGIYHACKGISVPPLVQCSSSILRAALPGI